MLPKAKVATVAASCSQEILNFSEYEFAIEVSWAFEVCDCGCIAAVTV